MADLSSVWLKLNYSVLTHKDELRKWWIIVLIAATVFVVVFTVTNAVLYVLGISKQNEIVQSMVESPLDFQSIRETNMPIGVEIKNTTAYQSSKNKYDFIATIDNPNKDWYVPSFTYAFTANGVTLEEKTGSLMPNAEHLVAAFSQELANAAQASITVEHGKLNWQRVTNYSYLTALDFGITNIERSTSTASDGSQITTVSADIANNSFLGYWETEFTVVLYSGTQIVGVDKIFFEKFQPEESRHIVSQWEFVSRPVSNVEIFPDFDYLSESNIIK